jgi:hypothetical protein
MTIPKSKHSINENEKNIHNTEEKRDAAEVKSVKQKDNIHTACKYCMWLNNKREAKKKESYSR